MEPKIILQKGNKLQIKFDILHPSNKKFTKLNSKRYICGAVYFQVQALSSRCYSSEFSTVDHNVTLLVRFEKIFKTDILLYTCQFSSVKLEKQNLQISEPNTWHKVADYNQNGLEKGSILTYSFDVSFQSDIADHPEPLATLYDDTDSFDFKLCGEGGSVDVHKLILKLSSPVLQTMLSGQWKETSEGQITVADTTKETLEHFKEYIYLNKLPIIGVEQLLLVGSYFMMPDLVQKCVVRLLNQLDSDNILEMIEFAAKFKVTNLLVILLDMIKKEIVDIDHLKEQNITVMCEATNGTLKV